MQHLSVFISAVVSKNIKPDSRRISKEKLSPPFYGKVFYYTKCIWELGARKCIWGLGVLER